MKALVLTRFGGPEAMELREEPVPVPAANEVLVRVKAAGWSSRCPPCLSRKPR